MSNLLIIFFHQKTQLINQTKQQAQVKTSNKIPMTYSANTLKSPTNTLKSPNKIQTVLIPGKFMIETIIISKKPTGPLLSKKPTNKPAIRKRKLIAK